MRFEFCIHLFFQLHIVNKTLCLLCVKIFSKKATGEMFWMDANSSSNGIIARKYSDSTCACKQFQFNFQKERKQKKEEEKKNTFTVRIRKSLSFPNLFNFNEYFIFGIQVLEFHNQKIWHNQTTHSRDFKIVSLTWKLCQTNVQT